jgi:protein-tyrosine phosphatase
MSSAFDQINFSGESDCKVFRAHPLRADFCTECMKKVHQHRRDAVNTEQMVLRALEYSNKGKTQPSVILDATTITGSLLLGGYPCVSNLSASNVTHVVNTAKGLEMFGRNYIESVQKAQKRGVQFLCLDWIDSESQSIVEDLPRAVTFIHAARQAGHNVLVHCAMGKSRSASLVVAYIMCAEAKTFEDTLSYVQSRRLMAEPNPNFHTQLVNWGRSTARQALATQLAGALTALRSSDVD